MEQEAFIRKFLNIPSWYVLTQEEIDYLQINIDESENAAQVYWNLKLDCAACCNGCFFCGEIKPICVRNVSTEVRAD